MGTPLSFAVVHSNVNLPSLLNCSPRFTEKLTHALNLNE